MKTQSFIQGKDNFGYILHSPTATIAVDPLDASLYERALEKSKMSLTHILITHYHADHIGGVAALKKKYPACQIIGPEHASTPAFVERTVDEASSLDDVVEGIKVWILPGHAAIHAGYEFTKPQLMFVGDILFHLGCGRPIEGTMEELFESLQRLKRLPTQTELFVGHDYREKNLRFAQQLDPTYYSRLYADDLTDSTTLEMELWWNPFMRLTDFDEWVELRLMRNSF